MKNVTYLCWDSARPEINGRLTVVDMFTERPDVWDVVKSKRFRMLASAYKSGAGDWRTVNEFVDLLRGLNDLIYDKEVENGGAESARSHATQQLDGRNSGGSGRP